MDNSSQIASTETALQSLAAALSQNGLWSFGQTGRPPYSKNVRLLPDGRIGGYINPNERFWSFEGGAMTIFNSSRVATTVFDRVSINAAGRPVLLGKFVGTPDSGVEHYLESIVEPYNISSDPEKFKIDRHFSGEKRRNLVIMGANEASLHHQWPQDISNSERNWDLCLSFYGDAKNYPPPGPVEYTSLQTGVRKWQAIHAAMYEGSPFWEYERILVLDDDMLTSWRDINDFFVTCRALNLILAQPSLKAGCWITHPITKQEKGKLIRFTTFVEAMAPCFTSDALRQCISVTQGGFYGFGIDHLWPMILGLPTDKIGIVDAIAMEHTRPLGTNYPIKLAKDEEQRLFSLYGIRYVPGLHVLGSIPREG